MDWVEVTPDSFIDAEPARLAQLDRVRACYPLSFHSIGLDLGGDAGPASEYVEGLHRLIERFEPTLISDHLWGRGRHRGASPSPQALPRAPSLAARVAERVARVQDRLGRRILVENVGSGTSPAPGEMTEWELVTEVAARSDSLLLVDLGNVYASGIAKGFEPEVYLQRLPADRVWELHLSTPLARGDFVADEAVDLDADPVWQLYRRALEHFGAVSTLIERPDTLPDLEDLRGDLAAARRISAPLIGCPRP